MSTKNKEDKNKKRSRTKSSKAYKILLKHFAHVCSYLAKFHEQMISDSQDIFKNVLYVVR